MLVEHRAMQEVSSEKELQLINGTGLLFYLVLL